MQEWGSFVKEPHSYLLIVCKHNIIYLYAISIDDWQKLLAIPI